MVTHRNVARPCPRTPPRAALFRTGWRLFLTCWLVYVLHFATNTVREIYPALSLGDGLTFDVSPYLGLHPDIFELAGRGAYIDNNPGASILAAVPYALARPVIDRVVERVQAARAETHAAPPDYQSIYPMAREFYRQSFERGFDVKFALGAAVMQAGLMAPLSALSAGVMFVLLTALTGSTRASLVLSLLYAFATPVFFRTGQLNHNLLVSHFALFAFALLWRPWAAATDRRDRRGPWWFLAGLLAGWTVVMDYSGVVVVGALGLYALFRWRALPADRRSWLDLPRFGSGVALSLSVLIAYQWLAFGNPLLPAQRYMPPTPYSGYGYNGMGLPQADLLWDTSFGSSFGLFTSAPILVLALYPPAWLSRRVRLVGTLEARCIFLLAAVFFLFASANQFGRLQFNSGVRYVVPTVPFLFLIAAGVLLRLPRRVSVPFAVAATYVSWCLAMYRDVEQNLGVLDGIIAVTTGGPRLPWLMTLHNLGYAPGTAPILAAIGVALTLLMWSIWRAGVPRSGQDGRVAPVAQRGETPPGRVRTAPSSVLRSGEQVR